MFNIPKDQLVFSDQFRSFRDILLQEQAEQKKFLEEQEAQRTDKDMIVSKMSTNIDLAWQKQNGFVADTEEELTGMSLNLFNKVMHRLVERRDDEEDYLLPQGTSAAKRQESPTK